MSCTSTCGISPRHCTWAPTFPAAGRGSTARASIRPTIGVSWPRSTAAFKLCGSHGGYYAEGRTVAPLVASCLVRDVSRRARRRRAVGPRRGSITPARHVGSPESRVARRPRAARARPQLQLSVGGPVGSAVYVWRSAVCVDAHHDLVYAAGPGLNVTTLGQVMQRAGCVRAMELDINSWWVTLMTFTPDGHGGVTPWKLLSSMVRNPRPLPPRRHPRLHRDRRTLMPAPRLVAVALTLAGCSASHTPCVPPR